VSSFSIHRKISDAKVIPMANPPVFSRVKVLFLVIMRRGSLNEWRSIVKAFYMDNIVLRNMKINCQQHASYAESGKSNVYKQKSSLTVCF